MRTIRKHDEHAGIFWCIRLPGVFSSVFSASLGDLQHEIQTSFLPESGRTTLSSRPNIFSIHPHTHTHLRVPTLIPGSLALYRTSQNLLSYRNRATVASLIVGKPELFTSQNNRDASKASYNLYASWDTHAISYSWFLKSPISFI